MENGRSSHLNERLKQNLFKKGYPLIKEHDSIMVREANRNGLFEHLTPKEQKVAFERYIEGKTQIEIAAENNVTRQAVSLTDRRAKEKIIYINDEGEPKRRRKEHRVGRPRIFIPKKFLRETEGMQARQAIQILKDKYGIIASKSSLRKNRREAEVKSAPPGRHSRAKKL